MVKLYMTYFHHYVLMAIIIFNYDKITQNKVCNCDFLNLCKYNNPILFLVSFMIFKIGGYFTNGPETIIADKRLNLRCENFLWCVFFKYCFSYFHVNFSIKKIYNSTINREKIISFISDHVIWFLFSIKQFYWLGYCFWPILMMKLGLLLKSYFKM